METHCFHRFSNPAVNDNVTSGQSGRPRWSRRKRNARGTFCGNMTSADRPAPSCSALAMAKCANTNANEQFCG